MGVCSAAGDTAPDYFALPLTRIRRRLCFRAVVADGQTNGRWAKENVYGSSEECIHAALGRTRLIIARLAVNR